MNTKKASTSTSNSQLLREVLDEYFKAYDSTKVLVTDLIQKRAHSIEILILLCARLDALASDAAKEETSSRNAFQNFLKAYSGKKRLFESVSAGDLYYELGYHRWLLEGTLPQSGRLHRYSKISDPFLHLLEDARLPLTFKASKYLLDVLIRILERNFHVRPGQRLSKPQTIQPKILETTITQSVKKTRLKNIAHNLPKALAPLIESKTISTLLYERFRCESIHSATMTMDEKRFFTQTNPYWTTLHSDYYGSFELIELPARFLLKCLDSCIKQYRFHLMAKGKIPSSIHFHSYREDIFDGLEILDESSLPEGGEVRLKIDR